MNRLKHITLAACLVLASSSVAKAQYTPFQGLGDIAKMNMDFDAKFYPWAWQQSQIVAKQTRGQQLPFNPMTISQSITEGNKAFYGYLHSVQHNSNAQLQAVENYSKQAILGYSPYTNGGGQGYWLPYGPSTYHMTPGGYIRPGVSNYGNNFYPR